MIERKTRFLVGLTGSIGMGKSTTAKLFAELGIPVWDADAAVHRLYKAGGEAVAPISEICSDAIVEGAVDRGQLKDWIAKDPDAFPKIEAIVHPLVAQDRADFIAASGSAIVVLDIPLLFETSGDANMDYVVVVSAPADVQRQRVLQRPGMVAEHFESILAKQMPDKEKRARADFVIETTSLEDARAAVQICLKEIQAKATNA